MSEISEAPHKCWLEAVEPIEVAGVETILQMAWLTGHAPCPGQRAAKYLGLTPECLRQAIAAGKIPGVLIGDTFLVYLPTLFARLNDLCKSAPGYEFHTNVKAVKGMTTFGL